MGKLLKNKGILSIIAVLCLLLTAIGHGSFFIKQAAAQEQDEASVNGDDSNTYQSQFLKLNKINPMQNKEYIRATRLLKRKLVDTNMHSVGVIDDLLFTMQGKFHAVSLKLESFPFRKNAVIETGLYNITLGNDIFNMDMTATQFEKLLNNASQETEYLSGDIRIKDILQARIVNEQNKPIGVVEDVLLDKKAQSITALSVVINNSAMGGKAGAIRTVAIPFEKKSIVQKKAKIIIALVKDQEEILYQFLKE